MQTAVTIMPDLLPRHLTDPLVLDQRKRGEDGSAFGIDLRLQQERARHRSQEQPFLARVAFIIFDRYPNYTPNTAAIHESAVFK
jgi:hypothetical protein